MNDSTKAAAPLEGMMIVLVVLVLMVVTPTTSYAQAGLLAGSAGATQSSTGVKKFLERKTEAFKEIMNDVMAGKDHSAMYKANQALSRAPGELIVDTSFTLSAVEGIAARATQASQKVKNFVRKLSADVDRTFVDVRSLAISPVKAGDGWSEDASLRLAEGIKKMKNVWVRKTPTSRLSHQSVNAARERIYQASKKPKQLVEYEKYRKAALANWKKNTTDKERSLQKSLGVGPDVVGFHDYVQQQKSGGGYAAALASITTGDGYASTLKALDNKERARLEQRRREQEARELASIEKEQEARELASIEEEQEWEWERREAAAREQQRREEAEQRKWDRLEREQQRRYTQQLIQNTVQSLNNLANQYRYSVGADQVPASQDFDYGKIRPSIQGSGHIQKQGTGWH